MFYEYALDPSVLSTWERTRYFLDAFGPEKGRFIAEYPRRWKKQVYEALRGCPDVEKKRIVERLKRLERRAFIRRENAVYDKTRSWLENAEAEDQRRAFRAIISNVARGTRVLDADALDDGCELWRVETGRLVARDAVVFATTLTLLLRASKRVAIVDPYFRADQDDKTRPLAEFCKLLDGRALVEVHFADAPSGHVACMQHAARALPNVLPIGMTIKLHCWKERVGGPRLHNRYLLTDIGGVKFGDSIELGGAGQQDHLSILDGPSRLALWEQYLGPSPGFDPACDPKEFTGRPPKWK